MDWLPMPERPRIEVHKLSAWIVPDSATAKSQRDFPNSPQRHSGNLDINRLSRHMITMACRASAHSDELFVIFRRTVGGYDMNVPAATDLLLNECNEFDELHIHRRRLIRMVTPQKIIEVVERRLIVCSALCPERD